MSSVQEMHSVHAQHTSVLSVYYFSERISVVSLRVGWVSFDIIINVYTEKYTCEESSESRIL